MSSLSGPAFGDPRVRLPRDVRLETHKTIAESAECLRH